MIDNYPDIVEDSKNPHEYKKLNSTDQANNKPSSQPGSDQGLAELDSSGIYKCYVIGMAMIIALGFLQFGKPTNFITNL